jgi:alcohol dehydrogenase class IV
MAHDFVAEGYPPSHALIPHGMSVGLNALAVSHFTAPADPERHRYAAGLMGLNATEASADKVGDLLADVLIALMRRAGMPNGLAPVGYGPEHVD